MSELPDFVSDGPSSTPAAEAPATPVAEAPAAAPAETSEAPQADERPRGADGKFLPKVEAEAPAQPDAAPALAPAAAEAPAPVAPAADPQHHVPLPTFLDMRDRLSATERENKELREWRQAQEARANRQPPPQAPDPQADPEGFAQWQFNQAVAQQVEASKYELRRDMSRQFATIRHGEETVNAAFDWGAKRCDEDPHFNAKVRESQDPFGFVVTEYQREQQLSQLGSDDWAAFQAWKQAQAAAPQGQAAPVQPAASAAPAAIPKPAAPRPSLASAPSAASSGAAIPRDGEGAYDAMFNR